MSIKLSRLALRDLDEIRRYTAKTWGRDQWLTHYRGLVQTFDGIAANPDGGRDRSLFAAGLRFVNYRWHVVFYARRFEVRDYRLFIKLLLGPGWMLYEAVMIVAFVLVLAVAGSAAGQVLNDSFGIPFVVGVGLMLLIVVTFNYSGRQWIERTLTAWGLLMSLLLSNFGIVALVAQGYGTLAWFGIFLFVGAGADDRGLAAVRDPMRDFAGDRRVADLDGAGTGSPERFPSRGED